MSGIVSGEMNFRVPLLYLNFLRDISSAELNSYAWGAAAQTRVQSTLESERRTFKGASWLLEFFILERIPVIRNDYIKMGQRVEPFPCKKFPAFLGWSSMLQIPSKNIHLKNKQWNELIQAVTADGVEWRPYERFNMPSQRIFFTTVVMFDYNIINYHRREPAPLQYGIKSSIKVPTRYRKRLKSKKRGGHLTHKLVEKYAKYITWWVEDRYDRCIQAKSK
ncbi:hypothetical protein Salat_1582000 [Sesamum alatum]|uniref:Aminotransferase-like plant mobile domain-containing protein n=1 Tax=Sesamum alatum TaxID=300844 RepID=A0AAE1YDJ9_9LAMI|nr:hypothetical protein Salat_1582000 [Sesamum alatum]